MFAVHTFHVFLKSQIAHVSTPLLTKRETYYWIVRNRSLEKNFQEIKFAIFVFFL